MRSFAMMFKASLSLKTIVLSFIFLSCVTAECFVSVAQKARNTPVGIADQDPEALEVLRSTVAALGGEQAIAGLRDASTIATCVRSSKQQSSTHQLRWLTKGEYYRIDRGEGDEDGMINGARGRTVMIGGKEVPVEERAARAFKPLHLPGMTISQALHRNKMKIETLDDENLQGKETFHVRMTDVSATLNSTEPVTEDWWIEKSSYLPVRVTFPMQGLNSLRRSINTVIDYSNFSKDATSGVIFPSTFARTYEGGPSSICTVTSFTSNQNLKDELFTRKSGGTR